MNFEEQFNPNHQPHPEVTSNPEAMQPASEATKKALLDAVTAKSAGGTVIGYSVNRSLFNGKDPKAVLLVAKFEEGKDITDARRIGQVYFPRGLDGGSDGATSYFLVRIPDGLHIERSTPVVPPTLEEAGVSVDSSRADLLLAGMKIGIQKAEAERLEREMGLDFVSEEEAKIVLGLVEKAQAR